MFNKQTYSRQNKRENILLPFRARQQYLPHLNNLLIWLKAITTATILTACAAGPDYQQPVMPVAATFKEIGNWQPAQPQDIVTRGTWWKAYGDPTLDTLMAQLAISNQNIIAALAQYRQAQALVAQARAPFFPTLSASASYAAQGAGSANKITQPTSGVTRNYNVQLQASWEPDLWGKIARNVEANQASTQASAADVETAQLSARSTLAQTYFQLRTIDQQKQHASQIVSAYTRALKITQDQYDSGITSRTDIATALTQLSSAQAALIDFDAQRAQNEHAIAVLIGQVPSTFSIAPDAVWNIHFPAIPTLLPTQLLERRPDIASAERRMAAANANIGVAQSAYFPALSFSATGGYQNTLAAQLFTLPSQLWSLGPTLALTLFDGGLRNAQVMQANAVYDQTVATYRQTVLTGIQEVEDNLATLRVLEEEQNTQTQAANAARQAADLTFKQYQAGTISYLNVATAEITANTNENNAIMVRGRRYIAHVALIVALGGGWTGLTPEHTIK